MKEFISKPANISKTEFWAATTIFVFAVFSLITVAVKNDGSDIWAPNKYQIESAHIRFNYYQYYFFPQLVKYTILYLGFLALNFSILPSLIKKKDIIQNIALIIVSFLIIWIAFGVADTYLKAYIYPQYKTNQAAYNFLFQNSFVYASWLMLMLGFYTLIKYAGLYLLTHSETIQSKYKIITQDGISAIILWMIILFLLLITNAPKELVTGWVIIVSFGIALYWYSFYSLIPESLRKKRAFSSYLGKVMLIVLVSGLPLMLFAYLFFYRVGPVFGLLLFHAAFQLLITAPLSWIIYKRQQQGKEEINILKTALGRSNANLDFLRSQINPHFLFNALNTIYGTALQENAERTGEGIEKLGDMMRFMLQENMQDKISLTREVDYLNNYISLQKLRTDASPGVKIQVEIEEQVNSLQIPPMLLIPFVENAFKHGISLREPSHIKITLQTRENILYFDVHNSIHRRPENDPERNKSGIGLNNVKQRLQLLYPGKHELIIREAAKEFFIHLTIQLA